MNYLDGVGHNIIAALSRELNVKGSPEVLYIECSEWDWWWYVVEC
jgi:hypothetical protein